MIRLTPFFENEFTDAAKKIRIDSSLIQTRSYCSHGFVSI